MLSGFWQSFFFAFPCPAAPLPCCPALPCPAWRVLVLSLLCLPCCATRPCHTLQTSPAFATTPSPAPRPPLPCPVCRRLVLSLFACPFSLPCLMILCNPAFTIQLLFYHLLEGFGCWVWGLGFLVWVLSSGFWGLRLRVCRPCSTLVPCRCICARHLALDPDQNLST